MKGSGPAPKQSHHPWLDSAISQLEWGLEATHCNNEGCAELAVLDFALNFEGNAGPLPTNQGQFELMYAVRLDNDTNDPTCVPPCGGPSRGWGCRDILQELGIVYMRPDGDDNGFPVLRIQY